MEMWDGPISILCFLHAVVYLMLTATAGHRNVSNPILQMKKLGHREIQNLSRVCSVADRGEISVKQSLSTVPF